MANIAKLSHRNWVGPLWESPAPSGKAAYIGIHSPRGGGEKVACGSTTEQESTVGIRTRLCKPRADPGHENAVRALYPARYMLLPIPDEGGEHL